MFSVTICCYFSFFKQKTAYEMRISDWSSDVCSSDLAVSVKTGEVLSTISVRKSIASIGLDANTFRYVAFKDLLELEAGVAYNESDPLALQQASVAAVYGLVIGGASTDRWCDRKSVVEGKSGGVGVDVGGRQNIIKRKKKKKKK